MSELHLKFICSLYTKAQEVPQLKIGHYNQANVQNWAN